MFEKFFQFSPHTKHVFFKFKFRSCKINYSNRCNGSRVKTWLGYPKGLSHFIFTGHPHLNMLLKLSDTFILKV